MKDNNLACEVTKPLKDYNLILFGSTTIKHTTQCYMYVIGDSHVHTHTRAHTNTRTQFHILEYQKEHATNRSLFDFGARVKSGFRSVVYKIPEKYQEFVHFWCIVCTFKTKIRLFYLLFSYELIAFNNIL